MPRHHVKDGLHRVLDIYRPNVREPVGHSGEEFLLVPLPGGLHLRLPLVLVNAPDQRRQLGAVMRRFFERKAITQLPQCRSEDVPSQLAVRADCGHDLIELDVRGLQCLGKDVEPVVTHKYRAGDIRHCYADITKARKLLGYEPQVTHEEGFRELAQWLMQQEAEDKAETMLQELSTYGLTA